MPGEIDRNGPGQDGGRDVPVGAVGRTSDESRAGRRFKEQARVLGLADGFFVDEDDDLSGIPPPAVRLGRLVEGTLRRPIDKNRMGFRPPELGHGDLLVS